MNETKTAERQSLINKLNNFKTMLRSNGDINASNFEAIANRVTEMLQNPVDFLSQEELEKAYEAQQHKFDVSNILNELVAAEEDYIENFDTDKRPVTNEEVEQMAKELRKILKKDADAVWSTARCEAVTTVLKARPQILIGRPLEGVSINGLEYVVDEDGKEMKFTCIAKAKAYLKSHGITEDDIEKSGIVFTEEEL